MQVVEHTAKGRDTGTDVIVSVTETGEKIALLRGATIEDVERAYERYRELLPELRSHFGGPEEANRVVDAEALEAWYRDHGLEARAFPIREQAPDCLGFELFPLRLLTGR